MDGVLSRKVRIVIYLATMTATSSEPQGPSPEAEDFDQERILRRIPGEILSASFVLAIPAALLFGLRTALVFLAGGVLSALGFSWLKRSMTRFLSRTGKAALKTGLLMYLLRLLLICAAFLIIILLFPREILAFGAGFSVLVPVFLFEGSRALLRMRTWKT
jgi:hypothetical protein